MEMKPCDIHEATHVLRDDGRVEKIVEKWGIEPNRQLAPPSRGGFGVVTESGARVSMWDAKRFYAESGRERTFHHFRTGDKIRAEYKGQTATGVVELASQNGRSLMLRFPDRMLGGYVEYVPVLWTGEYFADLIEKEPVDLEREAR